MRPFTSNMSEKEMKKQRRKKKRKRKNERKKETAFSNQIMSPDRRWKVFICKVSTVPPVFVWCRSVNSENQDGYRRPYLSTDQSHVRADTIRLGWVGVRHLKTKSRKILQVVSEEMRYRDQ